MSIKCINVLIEGTECKPQIKSWYFHSKKANFTQKKIILKEKTQQIKVSLCVLI